MSELVDFLLDEPLIKAGIVVPAGSTVRVTASQAKRLEAQGAGKIKKIMLPPSFSGRKK